MPPKVIDVQSADDIRDVVHRTVQALAEGKLVVVPTETVYGLAASALAPGSVERLLGAKHRVRGQALTLAVKSAGEARDFVPDMSLIAQRLARRCWPGPLTLVLPNRHPEGLARQLPPLVAEAVSPEGTLGLRVPDHRLLLDVLRLLSGPLVLTSANQSGMPAAVSAQDALEQLGDEVDLILDDGRSPLGQASSVVRVEDRRVQLLREGVVSASHIRRLCGFMVLVVCTGNTCRSPMAEVLLRRRLAQRFGCTPEELEDRGVLVMSAGIAAMAGGRAAAEAVTTMQERGLDLSRHESQPVSPRLAQYTDLILTMTSTHREALIHQWPNLADRTFTLCDGGDIADPIGHPLEAYRLCADQIDEALAQFIGRWKFEELLAEELP